MCVFGTHIKPHDLFILKNLPWLFKIFFMVQVILWGCKCYHCCFIPGESDPFMVSGHWYHQVLGSYQTGDLFFPHLIHEQCFIWLSLLSPLPGPRTAESTSSQPGSEGLCKSLPQLYLWVHFQQLSWAVQSRVSDRSCK